METAGNREGSSGASHRKGCQAPQEHAETGSDDPGDAEGSEARGGSFKVYVDRVKDGQNDTPEPQKAGQGARFVLTSRAGWTQSTSVKPSARHLGCRQKQDSR